MFPSDRFPRNIDDEEEYDDDESVERYDDEDDIEEFDYIDYSSAMKPSLE